jgi:hypothetical protein
MTVSELEKALNYAKRMGWGDAPVVYGASHFVPARGRVPVEGCIGGENESDGERVFILAPLSLKDVGGV